MINARSQRVLMLAYRSDREFSLSWRRYLGLRANCFQVLLAFGRLSELYALARHDGSY